MRQIALTVQYDGTDYSGFQIQRGAPTLQAELQKCLSEVLQHRIEVTGAGRTDAGVHALGQVVTLRTSNPIPEVALIEATNNVLPSAISVLECVEVPDEFHASHSARGKLYSYRILNRELRSPFINRFAWHVREALDEDLMLEAGRHLLGEHDFAAFAAAGSSAKTTVRKLFRLSVEREGDLIECRIGGNGFLYKMVRNIVGTLVDVGRSALSPADVGEILDGCDRSKASPTAPPQGLCLVRVEY